jgi:thiol-disulfide isomerase/thioredoxin
MLEQLQTGAYDLITTTRFWMIMAVIIFFIVVAIYLYYTYVTPMVDKNVIPNREYQSEDAVDELQEAELLFFTVDWCPHSKKAVPIWDSLKEEYGGENYNGYKLNFVQINGEENPDMADKYKVDGYPTIKLVKGNQVIEYDAKPTLENLKEFLNSTLS